MSYRVVLKDELDHDVVRETGFENRKVAKEWAKYIGSKEFADNSGRKHEYGDKVLVVDESNDIVVDYLSPVVTKE